MSFELTCCNLPKRYLNYHDVADSKKLKIYWIKYHAVHDFRYGGLEIEAFIDKYLSIEKGLTLMCTERSLDVPQNLSFSVSALNGQSSSVFKELKLTKDSIQLKIGACEGNAEVVQAFDRIFGFEYLGTEALYERLEVMHPSDQTSIFDPSPYSRKYRTKELNRIHLLIAVLFKLYVFTPGKIDEKLLMDWQHDFLKTHLKA